MDLSLTSDFDSALLNCWDDEDNSGVSDAGGSTPAPASAQQESNENYSRESRRKSGEDGPAGTIAEESVSDLASDGRQAKSEESNRCFSATDGKGRSDSGDCREGERDDGGSGENSGGDQGNAGVGPQHSRHFHHQSSASGAVFLRLPSFGTSIPSSFNGSGSGSGSGEANTTQSDAAAAMHDLQANMEAALAGISDSHHGLPSFGTGCEEGNSERLLGGQQSAVKHSGGGNSSRATSDYASQLAETANIPGAGALPRGSSVDQSSSTTAPVPNPPQHTMLGKEISQAPNQGANASREGDSGVYQQAQQLFLTSANPISAVAPAPALLGDASRSKSIITQRMHEGAKASHGRAQQLAPVAAGATAVGHKPSSNSNRSSSKCYKGNGEASISSKSTKSDSGWSKAGSSEDSSSKTNAATVSTSQTSTQQTDSSTTSAGMSSKASVSAPGASSEQEHQASSFMRQHQQKQATVGQMHPLAMSSSSDCPPHIVNGPFLTPGVSANLPFMYNPLFMQAPIQPTNVMAMFQQQQQQSLQQFQQQQQLRPTSQVSVSAHSQQQQRSQAQKKSQNSQQKQSSASTAGNSRGASKSLSPPPCADGSNGSNSSGTDTSSVRQGQDQPQQQQQAQAQQAAQQQIQPPPFLLFDAPCELRTNFLQSQRMHNLPSMSLTNDNNSYHYGMAVNGFHPQLNAQVNPILPLAGSGSGGTGGSDSVTGPGAFPHGTAGSVQLIDGRHNKNSKGGAGANRSGSGKERNEREQRRAQKITELIEKLRLSMVKGGWKVEMKSKYHTLSTCADYVKHLIKTTKEKEAAVEKAKSDLSIKEQKLEEDKALQESRSDPESVTSSLTASTAGSCSGSDENGHVSAPRGTLAASLSSSGEGKKSGSSTQPSSSNEDTANPNCEDPAVKRKKVRLTNVNEKSSGATGAGTGDDGTSSVDSSSGEEGGGSGGPGGKNISLDKMSSSVSDMTDSNRSSSDGTGGGNGNVSGKGGPVSSSKKRSLPPQSSSDDDTGTGASNGQLSSSSISSTAAVVRGGGSRERRQKHADVVIKQKDKEHRDGRKRKHRGQRECTSLDRDFELDYEEVFLTSNMPQLIATPAGRIVTWNDFFLRATGLTNEEAKRLSIFSIVRADKLSTLFELVANALRTGAARALNPKDRSSRNTPSLGSTDKEGSTRSSSSSSSGGRGGTSATKHERDWGYSAVTLPCIPFPSNYPSKDSHKKTNHGNTSHESDLPIPLYMTVTLMTDDDPRTRCFHCVLTDSPGTRGQLGSVTPELLAMLFTEHPPPNESSDAANEHTGSHSHKKQRLGEQSETNVDSDETNVSSI